MTPVNAARPPTGEDETYALTLMGMAIVKNVGTVDRLLRLVAGLALIALVFVGPQTPWGWIGVVPLLTAAIGFCPAYRLFGINTCKIDSKIDARSKS